MQIYFLIFVRIDVHDKIGKSRFSHFADDPDIWNQSLDFESVNLEAALLTAKDMALNNSPRSIRGPSAVQTLDGTAVSHIQIMSPRQQRGCQKALQLIQEARGFF